MLQLTQEVLDSSLYFVVALEGNWPEARIVAIAPFDTFENALVGLALMERFEGPEGTEYYRCMAERCQHDPTHIHQITTLMRIGEDGFPEMPENNDPLFIQ